MSLRRIFDPEVGRILWGFIWIKEVKLGFDNSLRPKNVSSLSIPPSPSRSLNWPRWRPSSLGWQWQPPLGQPGNGSKMVKAQLELELRKFEWLEQYGAYTLTISNSNFLSSAAWIHYRLTWWVLFINFSWILCSWARAVKSHLMRVSFGRISAFPPNLDPTRQDSTALHQTQVVQQTLYRKVLDGSVCELHIIHGW